MQMDKIKEKSNPSVKDRYSNITNLNKIMKKGNLKTYGD